MKRRTNKVLRHVGLIGEVDPRLDQRQRLDDLAPPCFRLVADEALELAIGLTALRRCFGRNQISQALHLRQIKPPVDEGAPRELARFGHAAVFDPAQDAEQGGDHRLPAMDLNLGHVLAGLAVRAGKPKRQRLVDNLAIGRIAHPCERRVAWRRHAADQLFERPARLWTANPHHCHGRRRAPGRKGKNGGAITGHGLSGNCFRSVYGRALRRRAKSVKSRQLPQIAKRCKEGASESRTRT